MKIFVRFISSVLLAFVLLACGGGGGGGLADGGGGLTDGGSSSQSNSLVFQKLKFTPVDDNKWDELAVRKVLRTFAYGGHTTDAQIKKWADMHPEDAIVQMLTFDAKNLLLSPNTSNYKMPNTTSLEDLTTFWSSDDSNNFINQGSRKDFGVLKWNIPEMSWEVAATTRGLNPFLHRVGLWETNYHMSANMDAGVHPHPMLRHYDDIIKALSENKSYDQVIAQGAKDAAVAYQYGHNKNVFVDGQFKGNEDFAREFHQVFMGITGDSNRTYFENTNIPNTARALTDMTADWHSDDDGGPDVEITFGTQKHYTSELNILHKNISADTADVELDAIAKAGIDDKESLANLPIMIIRHFADDNLTEQEKNDIRDSWASMDKKNLLTFLRAYAISTDFHSKTRFKYASSIERAMSISNNLIVSNDDLKYNYYNPIYSLSKDDIRPFRPIHDVFGHQTGLEASDSEDIFRANYNLSTKYSYRYTISYHSIKSSDGSYPKDKDGNKKADWEKDWAKVIPTDDKGKYVVKNVGAWLWNRFIADGGKNYGVLEEAYVTALLNGKDLGLFLDENNPLKVYTPSELTNNVDIKRKVNDGKVAPMKLDSNVTGERREANRRVGLAIAFIVATPYIYAQEGE